MLNRYLLCDTSIHFFLNGESYIVTSVGGGLPLPECLDGPLPTLVSEKAAKEACVDDRLPTRAVYSWWCRWSPESCGDPRQGPLSRWWLQIDCSRGITRPSAAVRIGSSSAVRIGAPAVRPWGVDCTCRALMSSLSRVPRFTRTCQARRWPSARPLPRPSRRSLRKLRDGISTAPSSFGRGRCVGLVLTQTLVQYNSSSLV